MIEGAAFVAAVTVLLLTLDANWIELVAVSGGVAVARIARSKAAEPLQAVLRFAAVAGRRKRTAAMGLGVGVVLLRVVLLPVWPPPVPAITDEFSHLLLADTLTRGRLTNPTHPMWRHFETIHVIQRPTYNSMYLPGQALFLAAGRLLTGHPWGGVLLSTALMTAAFCWMLRAWMPPKWAIVGAMIAALRLGVGSYWANSYWGGAVPALGGALVLGALPRLERNPGPGPAVWLASGLLLVLNARPFEGLVISMPVAWSLLCWLKRVRIWNLPEGPLRGLVTLVAVLFAGGAFTAYYCWRVTGSPFELPYRVNQKTYGWPLTLPVFEPAEVTHRHLPLRQYYEWEVSEHEQLMHFWRHPFRLAVDSIRLWSFYFGPLLSVFLVAGLCRSGRRQCLFIAMLCLAGAAVAVEQSRYPHYIAPVAPAAVALVTHGLRASLVRQKRGRPKPVWPGVLLVAWVLATGTRWVIGAPSGSGEVYNRYLSWWHRSPGNLARAEVENELRALGGRHLAIVRYGESHHWMDEWVYNEADIDSAAVVWAREMDPEANAVLIEYFRDRRIWLVTPEEVPRIRPYEASLDQGPRPAEKAR
jgi:hypothetical protein